MLGLVRVMSSLLAAHMEKTWSHTSSENRQWWQRGAEGSEGGRTGGTKTEGARGAEAPAPYSGCQRKFFILHSRLVLAGWYQQADIRVQLDE